MRERRKVGTVYSDFIAELEGLLRLDERNQRRYRAGPGRPGAANLSRRQMSLITEGIFMRAYSCYERFMEDLFILYSRGKRTRLGSNVVSFLKPKNGAHAREMIKSEMAFLNWNNPDTVIRRCETYFINAGPIKIALRTHITSLRNMRKIRNAIAHQSDEATRKYAEVVRSELRVTPLKFPEPGEFLLTTHPHVPHSYFLVSYLEVLKKVADEATY